MMLVVTARLRETERDRERGIRVSIFKKVLTCCASKREKSSRSDINLATHRRILSCVVVMQKSLSITESQHVKKVCQV